MTLAYSLFSIILLSRSYKVFSLFSFLNFPLKVLTVSHSFLWLLSFLISVMILLSCLVTSSLINFCTSLFCFWYFCSRSSFFMWSDSFLFWLLYSFRVFAFSMSLLNQMLSSLLPCFGTFYFIVFIKQESFASVIIFSYFSMVMSGVSLFLSSFLTVSKKFCFVTSLISFVLCYSNPLLPLLKWNCAVSRL